MKKKKNCSLHRMMILSVVYSLSAITMLSVTVYAWFMISNESNSHLISKISDVEAEYEFYIYQNKLHDGSSNLTLINNVCVLSDEDLCYQLIPDPTSAHLFKESVAPGEKFSFAIKILAFGNSETYLNLSMGGVTSIGYDLPQNRIQNAFIYNVTKIVYVQNEVETVDQKDNVPILYSHRYFDEATDYIYPLVKNIPVFVDNSLNASIVIFFDFYFDPNIFGSDINLIPYMNSNIFINQLFTIQDIYMHITNQLT